jgi:YVTN family beta-propeller protein
MRTTLLLAAMAATVAPAGAETLLVAGKADHTLYLVDLPSLETRATLPTGEGPHEIAVSPDGRTAVVSDYGTRKAGSTLTVIDVPAARVVRTVDLGPNGRPHGMAWIDSKRLAVTTEQSRRLLVVEPQTGRILQRIGTAQEVSHMVALSPDASRAWVANIGSGTVSVIDLESSRKLADVETGAGAEGIAVSPDGRKVWVTNTRAGTVSVIDASSLELTAAVPAGDFPIRVALTPDGSLALVTSAGDGSLRAYDAARIELAWSLEIPAAVLPGAGAPPFAGRFGAEPGPIGLLVAPDGGTAWVACTNADALLEVDLRDGSVVSALAVGSRPDGMALSTLDVRPATAGE